MNIMTIHHLCYYLEEIGIIDQSSITPFLSLYSFALNKSKEKENLNTNTSTKKSSITFENILCAYLKKIFSIEKNYKIFSNKIINKFKQHFMLKQYNGLILLFSILNKVLQSYKIQSFYKIINMKKENFSTNLNTYNNIYTYNNINSPSNKINLMHEKKTSFDSFRIKHLKKNKKENDESKSEILNKSVDFIKIKKNYNNNDTIPSINKSKNNNTYANDKNIQLEFKKKQFLSKLKREHIVKFKRTNSNSAKKLTTNNSNKNFESKLLNNFPSQYKRNNVNVINDYNDKKNKKDKESIEYNDNYFNPIDIYNNDINFNKIKYDLIKDNQKIIQNKTDLLFSPNGNSNYSNHNFSYNNFYKEKTDNEGSLNKNIPEILNGGLSAKSENINFASFVYSSPSYNQLNTPTNYKLCNKENIGHIIKKNDKKNIQKDIFNSSIDEPQKNLTLNEINRIKKKLESLNYFNLNS